MKNKQTNVLKRRSLLAIISIAMITVIGFSFTACDDGNDNDPTPQTVTYSGTANGTAYTLKITENLSRAAYTPQAGDSYVLTVGSKKSTGTVDSYSNGTFTLKPEGSATTFTASVSSSGLTGFTGGITWEGDTTPTTLPTTVTPTPPPNTGNPSDGSPAPKFTGVQVYTLDDGVFTAFSGTGSELDVSGFMSDNYGQYDDLGKIGTISSDGKLTLELPSTIADDKLFLVPTEMGGNGVTKFVYVGIQVYSDNSDDDYDLWLYNSSNTNKEVLFVYFDRDFSTMGLSVKKGWNYVVPSWDDDPPQIIFDISNHKWVIALSR